MVLYSTAIRRNRQANSSTASRYYDGATDRAAKINRSRVPPATGMLAYRDPCYTVMVELNINTAKAALRRWIHEHPHAVLYDEDSGAALDVASGKALKINWFEVAGFEEKTHPETEAAYLVLLFESGVQIAFVDSGGIGFAPSMENSGPVRGLPAVVCLADFLTLKGRVDHYLYDHPDEQPPRECLDMILACIATLDGARAVGFDVGELERELEKSLHDIERRTA